MSDIHMGELLKKAVRKKGLNLTELASALNITRRTLYNWFKQEIIDQATMERIADIIQYEFNTTSSIPIIIQNPMLNPVVIKDELYWQDKYIDLLERYSKLLGTFDT
jgi:transcriptional regulator with XRE-family HTH domain